MCSLFARAIFQTFILQSKQWPQIKFMWLLIRVYIVATYPTVYSQSQHVVVKWTCSNFRTSIEIVISSTLFQTFLVWIFLFMWLFLIILMTNRADPVHTAPSEAVWKERSDLGLHCLHMPLCQELRWMKFEDMYCTLLTLSPLSFRSRFFPLWLWTHPLLQMLQK